MVRPIIGDDLRVRHHAVELEDDLEATTEAEAGLLINQTQPTSSPNLSLEFLQALLKRLEFDNRELGNQITRGGNLNNEIGQLVSLNKMLGALKEDDVLDQTPMAEHLAKLNVTLDKKTTVARAKDHFDALISSKRSELSTLISTKFQVIPQTMQTLIDLGRNHLRQEERIHQAIQAILGR